MMPCKLIELELIVEELTKDETGCFEKIETLTFLSLPII
jgi:hypothetical protein